MLNKSLGKLSEIANQLFEGKMLAGQTVTKLRGQVKGEKHNGVGRTD